MKTLIGYEVRKLLHRRALWYVLIALLCANAFFLHRQINAVNEAGYSTRDLAAFYQELEGDTLEEQYQWLQEETARIYEALFGGEPIELERLQMAAKLALRLEDLMSYDDYLAEIDAQAERMMSSALFGRPGTFSYRNISRTPGAYADLKGLELTADVPDGVTAATAQPMTDAMVLLAAVILVLQLAQAERENGVLVLIKSKKLGRTDTIVAKGIALLLCTAVVAAAFYLVNLGMASAELGLGDLNRPLQAVEGYLSSPLKITVGQYLALFVLAKVGAVFAVACVFFLLCIACRNTILACVAGVALFGVEGLLWWSIDVHSWMSLLKQLNLAALMDTPGYFSDYVNLNLFGFPVNTAAAGLVTGVLAAVLGIGASAVLFSRESTSGVLQLRWKGRRQKAEPAASRVHVRLLQYEWDKVMVQNKGLLILALYLALQVGLFCTASYHINAEEFFYQQYSQQVSGPLTAENEAYLQAEQARFDAAQAEQQKLLEQYQNGEISGGYYQYAVEALDVDGNQIMAFQRTVQQYQKLQAMEEDGIPVHYVYQTPWSMLFGEESVAQTAVNWIKLAAVLILVFAGCEAVEHTTHMEELLPVTSRGRSAVTKRKIAVGTAVSCVTALLTFVPTAVNTFRAYGTGDWSAPGRSVLAVSWSPAGLTAGGVLAMMMVLYILAAVGCFLIVQLLSRRTRSMILTLLISAAVLVLPALAVLIMG